MDMAARREALNNDTAACEATPTMNARVVARPDGGYDVHPATAGAAPFGARQMNVTLQGRDVRPAVTGAPTPAPRIVARGLNGEEHVVYQAPGLGRLGNTMDEGWPQVQPVPPGIRYDPGEMPDMAAGRVPVEPENERAQTAADQGYGTILASLAYLLWKRGIITPGDYQVMSGATNCNLFEIAAKIIEIADDPRT